MGSPINTEARREGNGGEGRREEGAATLLGELLIEPAICFGPSCVLTPAGQLKVQPKVVYEVVVLSTDEAGRQRLTGGEMTRMVLSSGPGPLSFEVADLHDGSYRLRFSVQVSGEYKAVVTIDSRPVSGSPLLLIAPCGASPRAEDSHLCAAILKYHPEEL
ncbi:MAG: hypothetical protein SGPRY_011373 [Prymnesium sp.]